jgi:hypothetical protein
LPASSDVITSAGTSTMTGPGRPFFSALKARRIAGTVCSGSSTGSTCFVTLS